METVSTKTFALLVHKPFVDRVCDSLLLGLGRSCCFDSSSSDKNNNTRKRQSPHLASVIKRLLDGAPIVSGVRKNVRGYVCMLLQGVIVEDFNQDLHPIARQNISSAVQLSHKLFISSKKDKVSNNSNVCTLLWNHLQENGFDVSKDLLRVDCFPKDETEAMCLGIQQAVHSECSSPFDGPINMTKSSSKCTFLLSLVRDEDSDCWWMSLQQNNNNNTKSSFLLNHDAAKQVLVEPTDAKTGKNLSSNVDSCSSPIIIPVSRAYYKLDQVVKDLDIISSKMGNKTKMAIDLGASPGGWTQVLHQAGFAHVLAVDPGILALRVANLPNVTHICAEMTSPQVANAITGSDGGIAMVVCDASTDFQTTFPKLVQLVEQVGTGSFSLPCTWVVTLKLPYKTVQSMKRNLAKVLEPLPSQLETIGNLAFGKQQYEYRFKVQHLMANSDAERTIVAVYTASENKQE